MIELYTSLAADEEEQPDREKDGPEDKRRDGNNAGHFVEALTAGGGVGAPPAEDHRDEAEEQEWLKHGVKESPQSSRG